MKKLYRSKDDKMLAGVCGGLGTYFNIDPVILRLIWGIVSVFTFGVGLIAYVLATIIIPLDTGYTDV